MRHAKDKDTKDANDAAGTTPGSMLQMSDAWRKKLRPFAEHLGITLEEVTRRLLDAEPKLISAANDRAALQMADPAIVTADDLKTVFHDAAKADLSQALQELQGGPRAVEVPASGRIGGGKTLREPARDLIPEAPESGSFLAALAATTSFEKDEALGIQALVEAYFVGKNGLHGLPERLVEVIRIRNENDKAQVGKGYKELRDFVTARRYGLDNLAPTDDERARLFAKLSELHRAVGEFHRSLDAWNQETKQDQMQLVRAFLQGQSPEYPDPESVLLASETLAGFLKDALCGDGGMTARALAYEGRKIREMLERDDLLSLLRVNDVAQMQQVLNYRIDKAACKMERTVVRYVHAATYLVPNAGSPTEIGELLEQLHRLGHQLTGWMANGTFPAAREYGRNRYPRAEPAPITGGGTPWPPSARRS